MSETALYNGIVGEVPTKNLYLGDADTLASITTGDYTIAVGGGAGKSITSGSRDVLLGSYAGYYHTTESDILIIDNEQRADKAAEIANALIYGYFENHASGPSLNINGTLIATDVIQAPDFAKTGWPVVPDVTLSFNNGTRTFTVTDGGTAFYYVDGVKYTLGGNKTVIIDDTEGLWYIYFVGDTLTASQSIWSFSAEDKALVGYLYWDATNNVEIYLGYELHTFHMDGLTHARLHYAGGAMWETGLLVSDAGSEIVNVSAGDFWDEDVNIPIIDGAGAGLFEQVLTPAELPIYYRDGASNWRLYETADKANPTDIGFVDVGDDLKYNKLNGTWANATVTTGKYVAYWVVAIDDQGRS